MKGFVFILLSIGAFTSLIPGSCNAEDNSYVFYMSRFDQGTLDICYMDIGETITISSIPYEWGKDFTHDGDIYDFRIAPKGDYVVINDFNLHNGGIYRVNEDASLQFAKAISGGFSEGGFSHDGEYFYTTQGVIGLVGTYKPYLIAIKVNGGNFDIIAEQHVATTATMRAIFADQKENLIASAMHGMLGSPGSLIVYQFDRETLKFNLRQYILCDMNSGPDMDPDRKYYLFARNPVIGSLSRNAEGNFEKRTSYWDWTHWDQSAAYGIRILPDASFAVTPIFNDFKNWTFTRGGVALFSVSPTGELNYESIYPLSAAETIGMTPDGRFFLVTSMYGTKIGVFRINRETRQMEKLKTFAYPNGRPSCIRFLPQFVPKTSVKAQNWSLYTESADPSSSLSTTRPTPIY